MPGRLYKLPDGRTARISEDRITLVAEREHELSENGAAAQLYEDLIEAEYREMRTTPDIVCAALKNFDTRDDIRIGVGCEKDGAAILRIESAAATVLIAGKKVI
jgi:hypothetical protein